MWYIHTTEYFSAIERFAFLTTVVKVDFTDKYCLSRDLQRVSEGALLIPGGRIYKAERRENEEPQAGTAGWI